MKNHWIRGLLLLILLTVSIQIARADSEGGPLRFSVRVGAGEKTPVSGRLLIFFGPLQSASEEMTPGFGVETEKIWIAAREVTGVAPGSTIDFNPDELVFPAAFSTRKYGDYRSWRYWT